MGVTENQQQINPNQSSEHEYILVIPNTPYQVDINEFITDGHCQILVAQIFQKKINHHILDIVKCMPAIITKASRSNFLRVFCFMMVKQ